MPELIVVGKSKIAEKLMDLATVADFKVTLMAKSIQSEVTFKGMKNFKNKYVVIASQGEADEEFYINSVCNVPIFKKSPKHILEYL